MIAATEDDYHDYSTIATIRPEGGPEIGNGLTEGPSLYYANFKQYLAPGSQWQVLGYYSSPSIVPYGTGSFAGRVKLLIGDGQWVYLDDVQIPVDNASDAKLVVANKARMAEGGNTYDQVHIEGAKNDGDAPWQSGTYGDKYMVGTMVYGQKQIGKYIVYANGNVTQIEGSKGNKALDANFYKANGDASIWHDYQTTATIKSDGALVGLAPADKPTLEMDFGKTLPAGSQWQIYGYQYGSDGVYLNLGGDQWIRLSDAQIPINSTSDLKLYNDSENDGDWQQITNGYWGNSYFSNSSDSIIAYPDGFVARVK
ncbi:hypothetical protein FC83_GL002930 [Agrilactobacillus composti DSM 18527 = JCM 14202]|uniref:Uncharacterized protein n=1 Tax=Agrilactobacillus composti DSM 18527 = JCM 14202 TaxID=1423734 RepID=A0A0R1XT86_9LACO|nr:hypothetical protein FC83_GL002930 [Agrilactobacillus composti DSM 18527 = JCM 14202]